MRYFVKYKIKGYDEYCARTFESLNNAIRFIKYNDSIIEYKVYKLNLFPIDIKDDLKYY